MSETRQKSTSAYELRRRLFADPARVVDRTGQDLRNVSNLSASPIPDGDGYVHFEPDLDCMDIELSAGPHILVALAANEQGRPQNPQQIARVQFAVSE